MSSRLFDDREDQHAADREQREREDLGLDPRRCVASCRSRGEPTTTAACATIGLPTSTLRSAISSTARMASTRIVPCRNSPAPSIGDRAGRR